MSVPFRFFRHSVFALLCAFSGVCAGQNFLQFQNVPSEQLTGGQVTGFLPGYFQVPTSLPDILYVNAAVGSGASSSVTVGTLLSNAGGGFQGLNRNQIVFRGVSSVVATLSDFDGDMTTDFAFAMTPVVAGSANLCIYYGSGATYLQSVNGESSFDGAPLTPNAYPPTGGKNGCTAFTTTGSNPPNFTQIVPWLFKTSGSIQNLIIEDSANHLLYILKSKGVAGVAGVLTSFSVINTLALNPADGAGPIYTGDFNGDGNVDIIVNGQTGHVASVYFGNGDGTFQPTPVRYPSVHSMLLHDMDRDGRVDMVAEGANGVIQIFHGNSDGSFAVSSEGGTALGSNGFSGTGGQLAAIDPVSLDILTTTPIGLSVLQPQSGTLLYQLKGIYNIGPGRSVALADFYGTGLLDLAVNSVEGIPVIRADPNGDGGFVTSRAYAALAPALGSVVGKFRNAASNPAGNLDVVVNTGAVQGQLLTGNGDGTFNTFSSTVDPYSYSSGPPANLWSNVLVGDFNKDGNLDIGYSLTGLPFPSSGGGPGIYYQFGNGDGTFQRWNGIGVSNSSLYGETAVGDFDGNGQSDFANIDPTDDLTLLNPQLGGPTIGLDAPFSNGAFSQVAAGFFKTGRTAQQDLIFQLGGGFIPFKNTQDGTGKNFTQMPTIPPLAPVGILPATVLLTDVDGDGNGDLAVVYYETLTGPSSTAGADVYIWYGNGDGTFSNPLSPQIIPLSRNDYLGFVADMNGDGLPDLVLSDGSLVTILYNQGGTGSPANRTFGGEQHFLAGQGINSISPLYLPGNNLPSLVVANGGATISNPYALGGETASSLNLPVNPDVNTGGITVLVNEIATTPVTGTLVAVPEPSTYAATFTLTATLTPVTGTTVPQGVVTFSIDGAAAPCSPNNLVPVGGSSLSATATCLIPAGNTLTSGVHPITAAYSGSSVYTATTLTGAAGTHAIVGGTTTTTIYLCVGPTPACPSTGFVSPPFSAALTMYYGQTWNGTWTVSESDSTPLTGNFELFDTYNGVSGPAICNVPNVGGTSCPPAVGVTIGTGVGINVLTGVYTGDSTHTGSTSSPVTITVLQDTTSSATLTCSPNPSPAGQPVTCTATLAGNAAAPMGTVTFSQVLSGGGTTTLGTGTLTPGSGFSSTATFTTSALPLGTDTITATYAGTTDFAAATFPTFVETITPSLSGTFTLTATPNPVTVGVGIGTPLTVTVTPQNGFTQGVNLTCSNLPYEASCIFTNAAIPAGGGSTFLVVQTTPPHTCGSTSPYFYGRTGRGPLSAPFALPALAGLVLLIVPGKRRWLRSLLVVAIAAAITQMSGCTTCTDLGTRPGTYTFQVTGTAASSPTTQSQGVTMTVTI